MSSSDHALVLLLVVLFSCELPSILKGFIFCREEVFFLCVCVGIFYLWIACILVRTVWSIEFTIKYNAIQLY